MNSSEEIGKRYQKYASGLIIVKSKNSNFNADFTGTPRRLPDADGTIYATDKALKYCIRKYLKDTLGEPVFVWRRKKEDDQPMDISENFKSLFSKSVEETDKADILKFLTSCIDIRLFGATFAPRAAEDSKNTSITGSAQISYGIDKLAENIHYTHQISSPYRDPTKKGAQQTTIGDESKGLESHYVFDYVINYRHLEDSTEHLKDADIFLSTSDIENFKKAARLGVNNVNSAAKIGSENELFLFVDYSTPLCPQNLKDFVKISNKEGETNIDLVALEQYLIGKENNSGILGNEDVRIELYYDPAKTIIVGFEDSKEKDNVRKIHIITGEELEN
jgi:CRISPR-associated protein Csh2